MAFSFGGQSSGTQAAGGFAAASSGAFNLFGAASSPASQPASLFGANPFAQATTPTPLFGASQAPSGTSLFGASAPIFGTSSPSIFGAISQQQSQPSLFGGNSTPSFGFGTSQLGSQPAQANNQSQVAPASFATGGPTQPDYSALKELETIARAYNPNSPNYRFNHLFLNVVENPAARVKPQNVDELQWRAALQQAGGPNNPDCLWPVQAKGFKDLLARSSAQEAAMKEHAGRKDAAEQASRQLSRRQDTIVKERIETHANSVSGIQSCRQEEFEVQLRKRHLELSHKLLGLMRHIDALEGYFASSQGRWDAQAPEVVARIDRQLQSLESTFASSSAGGLERQVEMVATAAQMRASAPGFASNVPQLEESSLNSIFAVLLQQAEAISSLQDVLRRSNRDLAIIEEPTKFDKGLH